MTETPWYDDTDPVVPADSGAFEVSGSTSYQRLFDLAEGGMGRVELTVRRGEKFERLYAVKRLHRDLLRAEDARAMFLEEGRLAGLIHHPNVVGVLDVGEDQQGPFLVMEYVECVTARDVISAASREGIPLSVQTCCQIVAQAARGLDHAHQLTSHDGRPLQLVHRDVSPHNLLIGFDGSVRVADFGIARAIGRDHRTSTGVLKGKLGYMAPEVLQFQPADARTDLFSLGVVLFELLSAKRLYGGRDDGARARRILYEPPPDIGELRRDVPAAVDNVLLRMLSKKREDRPQSAREVAETLEAALHTLVEEEGLDDLETFISEGFGERRSERHVAIRDALEASQAAIEVRPETSREPGGRRGLGWAVALLAALLGAALFGGWLLSSEAPAESVPLAEAPREAAPEPVSITVHTIPPGAWVEADGHPMQQTPATLRYTRADAIQTLAIRLEGHEPRTVDVTPMENQRLELVLTPLPTPEPAEPPEPAAEPERPVRRGRARRRAPRRPPASEPSSLDTFWGAE